MSGPTVTDWISAGSSVVQTIGALLAIGVTAVIARRGERDSARREREARDREDAARQAADRRADEAIARAAAAEQERISQSRKRVAEIGVHAIDLTIQSFDRQLASIRSMDLQDGDYGRATVALNWAAADTAGVTLRAIASRAEDPMLATLLEQGITTLERPETLSSWDPEAAQNFLASCGRELRYLREGLIEA
nr:hypothetical protein GCM10017606_29610 [Microbacterium terregens]